MLGALFSRLAGKLAGPVANAFFGAIEKGLRNWRAERARHRLGRVEADLEHWKEAENARSRLDMVGDSTLRDTIERLREHGF